MIAEAERFNVSIGRFRQRLEKIAYNRFNIRTFASRSPTAFLPSPD